MYSYIGNGQLLDVKKVAKALPTADLPATSLLADPTKETTCVPPPNEHLS
ncbi:hypothetical protein EDD27_6575 [Nonomuraea polychroma]|uniref:Uncharacterized protein n=2 Tax=Nonomuraea polychroma TaxID=46176 RepID=A0A438MEB4_9ACTN|nr:hypothetical protein EDD27_6575 [Nonomuraea polychroma]